MSEKVTVRHRDGGPKTYIAPALDVRSAPGHEIDVDPETAEYLVDETGHFERVSDSGGSTDSSDGVYSSDSVYSLESVEKHQNTIESGQCPWCDEYGGENVAQHASSAHPDLWSEYRESSGE